MEDASFHKIEVCLASAVSPKTAIDISSSFVKEQWGHFHSKKVLGFESCAVLPVVEALLFAPIVNVCLED
jgi:hypothetical protein